MWSGLTGRNRDSFCRSLQFLSCSIRCGRGGMPSGSAKPFFNRKLAKLRAVQNACRGSRVASDFRSTVGAAGWTAWFDPASGTAMAGPGVACRLRQHIIGRAADASALTIRVAKKAAGNWRQEDKWTPHRQVWSRRNKAVKRR